MPEEEDEALRTYSNPASSRARHRYARPWPRAASCAVPATGGRRRDLLFSSFFSFDAWVQIASEIEIGVELYQTLFAILDLR